MEKYTGSVILESLEDELFLNELPIIGLKITKDENPTDRWHIFKVEINREQVEKLKDVIKDSWYAHFWIGDDVLVVYKSKIFSIDADDRSTWKECVDYGLSIGIIEKQLDFPIK